MKKSTKKDAKRPFWLREPCPEWCTTKHRKSDNSTDRQHSSEGVTITLSLEDSSRLVIQDSVYLEPVEVDVWMARGVGEREPRVIIAPMFTVQGPAREFTLAEAKKLRDTLSALLDQAKDGAK